MLEEIGRRQDIEIVLMGGIRDGVDAVKALCLGADAVAFGTSAIIAGGCIACMQCHIGQCVTGIATQDPVSRRGRCGVPGGRALASDADRPRGCRISALLRCRQQEARVKRLHATQ